MSKFSLLKKVNLISCCKSYASFIILFLGYGVASAQNTYYIDGYHGGVWGHYPDWNTQFMADMLQKHPYWKINLEIEPETWDKAEKTNPAAYANFKNLLSAQQNKNRLEYVNPAYGQSYMYNIEGESIIRQFSYGMKKLHEHFPDITFTSYSSEEPCFTSALPQILTSFGIKYASLKNPNTCFGGYTAAHGGELVNWQGPDGTKILTVPRYEVEKLLPNSTWQTTAWNNSPEYISAAFKAGIKTPVGMTLQDAGWKGGPFLGGGDAPQQQNKYTTWREYFELVKNDPQPIWKVSQEDIKVSLVWGSQVMQRIAQQVRATENKLLGTEKLLAIANFTSGKTAWPQAAIDTAWTKLLLSQHHDCWIVPYNGGQGNTWANKVVLWTNKVKVIADSLTQNITKEFDNQDVEKSRKAFTVYNTQIQARNELVMVPLPADVGNPDFMISDDEGKHFPTQLVKDSLGKTRILFNAEVPAFGYKQFYIDKNSIVPKTGAQITKLSNGDYQLETTLYKLLIDPKKGGTIKSLYHKKLLKEFVDQHNPLKFGGLRGNFYQNGGFKTTWDAPAEIKIIENGPLQVKLEIHGKINETDFVETITAGNQQPVIDFDLLLNWKQNVGIGEDTPKGTYKLTNYHKAFYDDSKKLLALFPLNFRDQKVAVNAPFDVTESKLKNTFFSSWDSIKNNIFLNWVDVSNGKSAYGMALFTDHTTNYTHGGNFPLGLDVQFSGMGLWGRDHTLTGPTHLHYAIMPHAGDWNKGDVWATSARWNEPMIALADIPNQQRKIGSIITTKSKGLMLSSAQVRDKDLIIRVLNTDNQINQSLNLNFNFDRAILVDLTGKEIQQISDASFTGKNKVLNLAIPKFGFRTIKLINAINHD